MHWAPPTRVRKLHRLPAILSADRVGQLTVQDRLTTLHCSDANASYHRRFADANSVAQELQNLAMFFWFDRPKIFFVDFLCQVFIPVKISQQKK